MLRDLKIYKLIYRIETYIQRRIQNPVKHLRWSFLKKQLTAESHLLFFQKAPSCVFDWVLHTPLVIFTQNFSCLIHNACSVSVLSSHISDDFNFQDFQRHASHVLRPVLTYRPMKLFYLLEVIRYYKIKNIIIMMTSSKNVT